MTSPVSPLLCRICRKPVSVSNAKSDSDGQAIHVDCYTLKMRFEQASRDRHAKAVRPWNVIAAEVSKEQVPKKMTELVTELNQALDEQHFDGTQKRDVQVNPDGE